MSVRVMTKDGFFGDAKGLRAEFDSLFEGTGVRRERFRWEYWHVPEAYSYLRTPAHECFSKARMVSFLSALTQWGERHLGCPKIHTLWLSYYIDGCGQSLHSDRDHGPWAFVYSLTRWSSRSFSGGETLLMKPHVLDYWRSYGKGGLGTPDRFFQTIAPRFNRLAVFDPRVPHSVREIRGTRDPRDSRVVLHGWFGAPTLRISGALEAKQDALSRMREFVNGAERKVSKAEGLFGTLVVRARVGRTGRILNSAIVTSTLVDQWRNSVQGIEAGRVIREKLAKLRLPSSRGVSQVTVPFRFGPG